MQPSTKDLSTVSSQQPSWDCSQISLRAWIPTCEPTFAPLIKHGYVLTSHGRVVVASKDHAVAVLHRIYQPYSILSPSPNDSTFNLALSSLPAAVQTRASARLAASAPAGASQPTTLSLPSESADHYVVSPELLANVDRQLMETTMKTVEHIATRNELRILCAGSGRELIRIIS
eukprot:1473495-Pleurochrysis_carterae.AAC.2